MLMQESRVLNYSVILIIRFFLDISYKNHFGKHFIVFTVLAQV